MAIYYIDPHTTVNGTGTWASPWSINSATRTGLTNNDEIRIKGVALTSLLLPTVYTATVTNGRALTITAGGGLGADFPVGTVAYLADFDMFFKVGQVAGNVINPSTSTLSCLPILDTSVTTVTLRKVDTTTYPASASSSAMYTGSSSSLAGLTISDCWTSATTRVTDGTVKTLIHSTTTSNVQWNVATTVVSASETGTNVSMTNTHVLHGNTYSSVAYLSVNIYGNNSTYHIRQVYSSYYNNGGIVLGSSSLSVSGTTVTIDCISNQLFSPSYGRDNTFNFTHWSCYAPEVAGASSTYPFLAQLNTTFNFTNIISLITRSNGLLVVTGSGTGNVFNVSGVYDQISTVTPNALVSAVGPCAINFASGFVAYVNKRAATASYFQNKNLGPTGGLFGAYAFVAPTYPSGFTFADNYYVATRLSLPSNITGGYKQPAVLETYAPQWVMTPSSGLPLGNNILYTFGDGSDPFEILGINNSQSALTYAATSHPVVLTDSSVYRTAGPSLRSGLTTRTAALWKYPTQKACKNIRIPVTAGVSCTVSGYVRTGIATYANGDCQVSIVQGGADLATQSMTTACYNAWENFSLTFTPTYTGEVLLAWQMYYAAAGDFWLDDLTTT